MDFQQTNILSMTGNSDFATTADLAGYVDLTTSQTITSGIKTFNTLPQSSAVPSTANQLVNKTYVDGAFCTLGTTQTLTGAKTFNVNVRLNNTRNLIFGTTTGAVLNFTGANMYYDNQAGGGHYFFISGSPNLYIDSTGLNIESGKRIWFNGARCSITDNGTQLVYDVPTGNSHSFRTNNVQRLTIDGNGISLSADNRIFFASGSRIVEEGVFSNILYDTPTGFKHQFRVNNVDAVAISADANGGIITFSGGIVMREYTGFQWLLYQLPASNVLKYQVAGNDIMEIASGGAVIYESLSMRDGKTIKWDEGFTEIAQIRKDKVNKYLEYEVASTYRHRFSVNNVDLMSLSDGFYGLRTNDIDIFLTRNKWFYMDTSNNGISCDLSGNMNYRSLSGTGRHKYFVGANEVCSVDINGLQMGVSTIPGTYPKIYLDYTKNNWVDGNSASLRLNCSSIGSHVWLLNNVLLGYYNNSGLTMSVNNSAIVIGTTNLVSIRQNTTLLCMLYNVPTGYTHYFTINSAMRAEILNAGFRVVGGYYCRTGNAGAFGTNVFNTFWTGAVLQCWIDGVNVGNFTISDYRVKENITKARPVLDRLCKVEMIEYEMKDVGIFKKHGRHHGFIAHQVQDLFPELDNIVSGEKDAVNEAGEIQPQSICAEFGNLYLSAIQELNAKVEAQQKQIEAQQAQIDGLLVAMAKIVSQQIV